MRKTAAHWFIQRAKFVVLCAVITTASVLFAVVCAQGFASSQGKQKEQKEQQKNTSERQYIHVAVAANFANPLKVLAKQFTALTGVDTRITVSSSGTLFAQINHGAGFDVFLSADTNRPHALVDQGNVHPDNIVDYAKGRLAFVYYCGMACDYRVPPDNSNNSHIKSAILSSLSSGKLAIANPKLAPYGVAAKDTLTHLSLWNNARPHMVMGKNVLQAYQFFSTKSVSGAFVAYSLVANEYIPTTDLQSREANTSNPSNNKSSNMVTLLVPDSLHAPIIQSLVVNSQVKANLSPNVFSLSRNLEENTRKKKIQEAGISPSHLFVQYLLSNEVQQVLTRFGYNAVLLPSDSQVEYVN